MTDSDTPSVADDDARPEPGPDDGEGADAAPEIDGEEDETDGEPAEAAEPEEDEFELDGETLRLPKTVALLTDADLAQAAELLGVTPAHVRTVIDVESRGRGFDPSSGRPIILFEPHVFRRETKGRHDRSHPDLSYRRWGEQPYPRSQESRWRQLTRAIALNEPAALRSASWGLFQMMGFNHALAGHARLDAFVTAMCKSERDQLLGFAQFLISTGLDPALRQSRWADFARGYNGRDYARHGYEVRLQATYERQLTAGTHVHAS